MTKTHAGGFGGGAATTRSGAAPLGGGSPGRKSWYAANGSGRDSYIAVNNGGFCIAS